MSLLFQWPQKLAYHMHNLCWWFSQCIKSVTIGDSPTSQTCHQHIWSPTYDTNIDITEITSAEILIGSILEFINRPKTNMIISSGWILLTSCVWSWPVIPTVRNVLDLCKIKPCISSSRCRESMSDPLKGVKSSWSSALIDRHVFDRKFKIGPLWYKPSFRTRFSSVLKNLQLSTENRG